MALFSKSVEAARNDVAKAEATVTEWEAKAATVRAEARELDQKSGAMILADETQAEKISVKIQSLERTARAYDGAAVEAKRKAQAARKAALEVEAQEEDKLNAQLLKKSASMDSRVEELRAQLEELDGCAWERTPRKDSITGNIIGEEKGAAELIQEEASTHELRAAAIRYYIQTGEIPRDVLDLNNVVGTSFRGGGNVSGDAIPDSVRSNATPAVSVGA